MKAKAIIRIMNDLDTCDIGEGLVMVEAAGRSYTYNPRKRESGNEWTVNEDEDVLMLSNDTGTHWISCDAVTSIEI